MALGFVARGLKLLGAGSAGGGLVSLADKFLGNSDEAKTLEQPTDSSEQPTDSSTERPVSKTSVVPTAAFSTTTPKALAGFAAHVQKEVQISERVEQRNIVPNDNERDPSMTAVRGIGAAAGVLEDKAKDDIDERRRAQLKLEREQEEKKLEGDGIGATVFQKVGEYGEQLKGGILAAMSNFVTPALMFGGAYVADKLGLGEGTDLETVVDTAVEGFDRAAQVGARGGIRNMAAKSLTQGSRAAGAVSGARAAMSLGGERSGRMASAGNQAAQMITGKTNMRAAKYNKVLASIRKARAIFLKFARMTRPISSKFSKWLATLPKSIANSLKRFAGKAVKWLLIIEIIDLLYNSTQAFILGSISKEQWHKRNKEQVYKMLRLFGAPVLGMMILGLAGSPVPVLGNIAGGLAGFIIGMILGESLFYVLNMEALSNGFYDLIFQQKISTLIAYAPALIRRIGIELPKLLASTALDVLKAPGAIAEAVMSDRIATDEEIKSEYGEDIDSSELLFKAGEGVGTDENAILYAFKDIDTPEKYNALKKEFEENFIPEYNKGFGRDVATMEQYLQKELGRSEYQQLKDQVSEQMRGNVENEEEQLKSFLRGAGIEETPTIAGIGEVSDEEYARYQAGELIDVTNKDGQKVLMTEQELMESDNVVQQFKEIGRRRMRQRQKVAAREAEQKQAATEEAPTTSTATAAESQFVFSNVRYGALDPEVSQIIQTRRRELERQFREEEKAKYIENNGEEPRGSWRDHIRTIAQMRAEKAIQNEFRDQILAADAGTLASEKPNRTEQPAQGSQDEPSPIKTREAVTQTNENVSQNIIPAMSNMNNNITVLNQSVMNQQRAKSPPAGTEGPASPSSANPSRRTTDNFIDVGYVT